MRRVLSLFLFLLVVALFLNLVKAIGLGYWADFNIYYKSAHAAFHQTNPYLLKGQFIDGYIYPPIALFIFFPLLLFPLVIAGKIWTTLSLCFLILSLWFILKLYDLDKNWLVVSIVGIVAFSFFPVKYTLGMGQINHLILFLVTLGLYAYNKSNDKLAGCIWGAALAIKYYPILLLPYLFFKKKWHILGTLCATVILLFFISVVVIIPEATTQFLFTVFPKISTAWNGDYYNQSLSGVLMREYNQLVVSELVLARIVLSLCLISIALIVILKKKRHTFALHNLEISIFIILSLILNSFSWQHHFVLFLLPLFITYFTLRNYKYNWYAYIIPIVSYILVGLNITKPSQVPVLFQSHAFLGALLLWIFNLVLLSRHTDKP